MNRDDVTRMAREAQMPFYWRTGEITYLDKLERFASLVASAERERIKQTNAPEIERINAHIKELEDAVIAERKACVGLRKEVALQGKHTTDYEAGFWDGLEKYEDLIKARG